MDNNSKLEPDIATSEISTLDNKCKREQNTEDHIFRIEFNDEDNFNELKEGVISSLNKFFESKQIDVEFLEDDNFLDISVHRKPKNDEIPLFTISVDASPKLMTQSVSIPSYRRSIKDVLDFGKLNESSESNCERPLKANLCFNCSGSHSLKDCPEPRNQQKINRARKSFLTKNERYHIDLDQRFAHLKPGKLSSALKLALGLKSRELPSFFYRMRILGYPPGWLEDSKVANSGITVIDSEENTILISDCDENNSKSLEHKYDISKIINFPGFNVDAGSGYYDDYKYHNVPAMNAQQKKENFIKTLGGNVVSQGYKRKKIVNAETDNGRDSVSEKEIDSKVARLTNPPEFNTPIKNDLIEQSNAMKTTPTNTKSRGSPTLADLEAQQIELLEALQKSSCSFVSEDSFTDDSHVKINYETSSIEKNLTINMDNSSVSEKLNDILQTTPKNVLSSTTGTPVFKFSVFDQLPNGENFKEGVSDVINFENLPDSTGKYEEMKIVLNKIRTKINKLNNSEN